MSSQHDDDSVPELDDVVPPAGDQPPPNLDLFQRGGRIDTEALREAMRAEFAQWLEQELPGTLARLEDTLHEYLQRRMEASLPDMLDRIIKQIDEQDSQ